MCTTFYGMSENPFAREISVKHTYETADFKQAISRMKYLLEIKGIGVFSAASGMGKTYTARYLKENLNPDLYRIIYLSISKNLSMFDFYNMLAKELYIDVGNCYKPDIYKKIQDAFIRMVNKDKIEVIVILDDGHNLSKDILENFKIFFDFEMDSKDYVSVIILGHEELKEKLIKNIYESLKSRIVVNYTYEGLSREEVQNYVKSRLQIANAAEEIFTATALNALYSCSKSNLRRLNNLIMTALVIGYTEKKTKIDEEIIMKARGEIDLNV